MKKLILLAVAGMVLYSINVNAKSIYDNEPIIPGSVLEQNNNFYEKEMDRVREEEQINKNRRQERRINQLEGIERQRRIKSYNPFRKPGLSD